MRGCPWVLGQLGLVLCTSSGRIPLLLPTCVFRTYLLLETIQLSVVEIDPGMVRVRSCRWAGVQTHGRYDRPEQHRNPTVIRFHSNAIVVSHAGWTRKREHDLFQPHRGTYTVLLCFPVVFITGPLLLHLAHRPSPPVDAILISVL